MKTRKDLEEDALQPKASVEDLEKRDHQSNAIPAKKVQDVEKLKKSEEMYRLLADSNPDVIYRISIPEGRYEYISPSCTVKCGRSPEEFYRKPFLINEMLHPDCRDTFNDKFMENLKEKSTSRVEYRIIRKSGEVAWVSQSDVLIRDENGKPVAVQGIARDVTERKEAEEIKAKFESIVEHSNDAIISKNLKGVVTSWNHAAEKIYGYSKEEMLGKSTAGLIPEGQGISTRVSHDENYSALRVRKDGKTINVSLTLSPVKNSQGRVTGVSIISRDVTQEKKAEKELKASEERYKLLVENVPVGILHLDRNGKVTGANPKFLEILGSETCVAPEFHKFEVSGFSGKFRECLETGRTLKGEYKFTSAPKKYLQYNITPILDSENKVTGVIGACIDITERKQMEKALRESEEKFREVFNNVNDGTVLCKLEDGLPKKFMEVNDVVCRTLGYTREELLKMSFKDIIDPQMADKLPLLVDKIYKDGRVKFEAAPITKNGYTIPVEINSHIFKLNGMDVAVSVARNITDRKKAEKVVKDSLKEKELLLREIHHRVKNNLMVISSLLNMQSRQIKDQKVVSLLKDSQSRARSMAIIHEKLYGSNNLKKINFGDYIRDFTGELFKTYSTRPGLKLEMDVEDLMLDINTTIPLGLIVNELVSNSLKYAFNEDGGTVTVRFHREDDLYTLTVEDNGVGIPEDFQEKGSLGMNLVKNLTEQLDGELELDRTHGTCFQVRFREAEF